MTDLTHHEARARLEVIRATIQELESERESLETYLNIPRETRGRVKNLSGKSLNRAQTILEHLRTKGSSTTQEITQAVYDQEAGTSETTLSLKSLGCFISTLLNYLSRQGAVVRVRPGLFRSPAVDGEKVAPEYPRGSKRILLEMRSLFHEDVNRVFPMKAIIQWLGGTLPGDTRYEATKLIRILLRYGDIQRVSHGQYQALVPPPPTDTSG